MNLDAEEFWSIARLGHVLFEQEEYDEARAIFEGLTTLKPQAPYPWEALGWIASARDEHGRAIEFLKHAVKLGAGPEASLRLAEEWMKAGQPNDALNALRGLTNALGTIGARARALSKRCKVLPAKPRE